MADIASAKAARDLRFDGNFAEETRAKFQELIGKQWEVEKEILNYGRTLQLAVSDLEDRQVAVFTFGWVPCAWFLTAKPMAKAEDREMLQDGFTVALHLKKAARLFKRANP